MTTEVPWLRASLLIDAGFPAHGFSCRNGGCSPTPYDSWNFSTSTGDTLTNVEENFAILGRRLGVPRDAVKGVHQVHSARIVEALAATDESGSERADGLFTSSPALVVGVKTADCVPVLLADPSSRMVAALHAGWRGVVGGIVPAAVELLRQRHPQAAPLVAIGPHICAACFQVGPEVAAEFPLHYRPDPTAAGKSLVDMRAALDAQLAAAGVASAQIEHVQGCPKCDAQERFFSHRRSGGTCGRMFNFIGAMPTLPPHAPTSP